MNTTKLLPDFGALLKKYSLSSEAAKAVGVALVLIGLACLVVFGCPILIEHAWNDFFHAIFGLTRFYYWNAAALVFWCLFVLLFLGCAAAVVVDRDKGK